MNPPDEASRKLAGAGAGAGARRKLHAEVTPRARSMTARQTCEQAAIEALEFLTGILRDPKAKRQHRQAAARDILYAASRMPVAPGEIPPPAPEAPSREDTRLRFEALIADPPDEVRAILEKHDWRRGRAA